MTLPRGNEANLEEHQQTSQRSKPKQIRELKKGGWGPPQLELNLPEAEDAREGNPNKSKD